MISGTRVGTIQEEFARRCDELLDMMVNQAREEDPWDIYLAKGAGDRAIAGDHEERHLLELLQNARDAIYRGRLEGDTSPGRVFVAVTEHGMAMANTGAPFRLNDEDVLKAVRFLMRSDKAGKGFIGHKGIGLKSILLRAGAFSVRSSINNEVLRATFSRYRTATYLLDKMRAAVDDFPNHWHVLEELSRMPLFTQPHPDWADQDALGADTQLVEALLKGNSDQMLGLSDEGYPSSLEPYTTVVYLPYHDEEWEQLLDGVEQIVLEERGPGSLQAFRHARDQMGTVSKGANADVVWRELMELDPRVLVLLGEINEIQFALFREGKLIEACRIGIKQPLSPLNDHECASMEEVALRVRRWSETGKLVKPLQHRTFIVLSAPTELGVESDSLDTEGPPEYIRILLEVPSSDPVSLRDEPLFLYYPIEASRSGLPFLIHGPFRVNSSRTALVPSQEDHNRQVLRKAVDLIGNSLDTLLKSESPLRRWLPWALLPLADPEGETSTGRGTLQLELAECIVQLLRKKPCVPTTRGTCRPDKVHFFPDRPDALSLLEELKVGRRKMSGQFFLLEHGNRVTYQRLQAHAKDRWVRAAKAIGLGQVDLLSFTQDLTEHLGRAAKGRPLPVEADQARAFFLSLCALLGEDSEVARKAAKVLGQGGVPLLPAFAGPAEDQEGGGKLLLVPAEARRETGATAPRRASRVVFWRPSSVKARTGDLPSPPSAIPVYFIDPSVVEAEGARAEGILSTFYDEWGTTRFESRPDLFRRVADRAAQLSGKSVLPVLGYLAGLLHLITSESFSGAEDLRPRPYAAIDIATLWNSLHTLRPWRQRSLDRQHIESAQLWAQVWVPMQDGEQVEASSSSAVFGPAWADFLERVAPPATKEEDTPPEMIWARAIRALISFRETIGRTADDPCCPELAPPDDPRWDQARRQLRRVAADLTPDGETRALFHLLLLFGVRIGPQVQWRWLDNRRQAKSFNAESRAVNLEVCRRFFEDDDLSNEVFPQRLAQTKLMQAYRSFITLEPYHAAFSGEHSWGHRDHLRRTGEVDSHLAAWIWLPDLVDADLKKPPFGGDQVAIDAFCEALIAVWPELASGVLWTGWYCESWHKGRSWKKRISSLAAFQLSRLELWQALPYGRLNDVGNRRFPAAVMVAWDREGSPSATEPAGFFPLMDIREEPMPVVARDLEVSTLSDLSFPGAVTRLRWLLQESRVGDGLSDCWQIAEFEGTSRDAWLAAQYRLLNRIVHRDPGSMWDQRTILTCRLALRAVRGEQQCAVPVRGKGGPQFAMDVAFFSQPPRYWERQENSDRWILETQRQLQTALYRWAEVMGATPLPRTKPPAYKGTPVKDPEAVAALRTEVQERLVLLLGTFKAHRAEKLDEMAERVIDALEKIHPVKPDSQEMGWSGLDEDGDLVFSIEDYWEEEKAGRSGAVVLAEGLALLVEQTTAVGDLQHALSAPPGQVERALRFRGVDLDELIREVRALARERMKMLLQRVERLVQALAEATAISVQLPTWQTDAIDEDAWVTAVQELKMGEGPLAAQALSAMPASASELSLPSCEALLCTALDEDLMRRGGVAMARVLLAVLREAGWPLEKRAGFARAGLVVLPSDLAAQQEACRIALNLAVVAALADRLASGELDGEEDIEQELDIRGRTMRDMLRAPAAEVDGVFLDRTTSDLGVSVDFDTPGLLLVEWDEETWGALGQTFREAAVLHLAQVPEDMRDLRSLLERCLEEDSLHPLRERNQQQQNERQARIRALEQSIEKGSLLFDPVALLGFASVPPLKEPTSKTTEAGRGIGGGKIGAMTVNQAVRGRLAELFVLEVCWQRFLSLDTGGRAKVLDAIEAHRQDGPGDVPWGTAVAWKNLKRRLAEHRDALVSCPDDARGTSGKLAKLFKDLIEVANERGPGFDVLDPFGVWGDSNDGPPSPRRVEIKAILPLDESPNGHRVILSTNEFHRARQHPESYVLRLICVPHDYQDVGSVRWACDVPDPVGTLHLDEKIVLGVRSGVLPFVLRPKA